MLPLAVAISCSGPAPAQRSLLAPGAAKLKGLFFKITMAAAAFWALKALTMSMLNDWGSFPLIDLFHGTGVAYEYRKRGSPAHAPLQRVFAIVLTSAVVITGAEQLVLFSDAWSRLIRLLLDSVGFNVETLSRPKLGHGIDPEGISRGMEMLKQLN